MGRRPWFPFYVDDWDGDRTVKLLTHHERGVYLQLLIEQWREGSLPDDVAELAVLAGESPRTFARIWKKMEHKFPVNGDGQRCNKRMAKEAKHADHLTCVRSASAKQRKN